MERGGKSVPSSPMRVGDQTMPLHILELRVVKMETDLQWIKNKLDVMETKQNWFICAVAGAMIVQFVGMLYTS
jgi:hypothetical protein